MVVSAIVFAISAGTRNLTVHSQGLHVADETLRVATAARAQVGFANHLAGVEREFGLDVSEELAVSDAQARLAIQAVLQGVADLEGSVGLVDPETKVAAAEFASLSVGILDLIEAGDSAAANELVATRLEGPYVGMFTLVVGERDAQLAQVSNADALMARMGDVARFLVALLIPLAVIVIYREIVRRQQRQAELELRLQAEREVGKARDDFLATASHEFRTPLTSIYGLSQLIEEDTEISESTRELAGLISTEAADLARMVEDLLTTARLDAGALTYHFEDTATEAVIEDVTRPFDQAGLVVEAQVEPATIHVDPLRTRQVLRNLVSNAQKYGGPAIVVTGRRSGDWFLWTVADNGTGVPPELEERLFERFMHQGTSITTPGGVGLGLSIVRALTEGMGGSVTYQRHNNWTRFHIRLPLTRQPAMAGAATAPPDGLEIAASSPSSDLPDM